jgi:hypothetical protein
MSYRIKIFAVIVHLLCPPCVHMPCSSSDLSHDNVRGWNLVNRVASSAFLHGLSVGQATGHTPRDVPTEIRGCSVMLVVHQQLCFDANVFWDVRLFILQRIWRNVACRTLLDVGRCTVQAAGHQLYHTTRLQKYEFWNYFLLFLADCNESVNWSFGYWLHRA